MAIEHRDMPEAGLHEPKGVSTAAAGTAYIADGEGSGIWVNPLSNSNIHRVGYANYNDYATSLSPLSISATTWTQLTNDGLGTQTSEIYLPSTVDSVWNASTNQFDFTSLTIGSTVDVRVDITITTSTANEYVALRIVLGEGDPSEYTLTISSDLIKTAGTYNLVKYFGFFIGNTLTKNNPAQLEVYADATCDVQVNGWYIKVSKPV